MNSTIPIPLGIIKDMKDVKLALVLEMELIWQKLQCLYLHRPAIATQTFAAQWKQLLNDKSFSSRSYGCFRLF